MIFFRANGSSRIWDCWDIAAVIAFNKELQNEIWIRKENRLSITVPLAV